MVQHNPDPTLHPFERAIEYQRALNATKLDKVFAKPFVCALDEHKDGVFCLERHPSRVSTLLSGSCDGEIRVWSLRSKKTIGVVPEAHDGFVRGLTCMQDGERFLSCGDDKIVKIWRMATDFDQDLQEQITSPIATYLGDSSFTGISHQRGTDSFATCGGSLQIWAHDRAEPLHTLNWGTDTIDHVKFNQLETHVVSTLGSDRSICLYDVRSATPIHKVILKMKSNALSWNPMEAYMFSVANEDQNCYSFDMRRLEEAYQVHYDHVAAVLDIDYSPTGKEFVTGSYDRTIRIFPHDQMHSREVYHTSRMHRIFAVKFSGDATYVTSGSEDTNIRLWKAQASKPLGVLHPRERKALEYKDKLKERYQHLPEIRRIAKHKHLPKSVKVARDQKRIHETSVKRKETNRVKRSKGKLVSKKPSERPIIADVE